MSRTVKDCQTLFLHVLSSAGFGRFYSFDKSAEPPKPSHMFNYRNFLGLILEHILPILVRGPDRPNWRLLPKRFSRIGQVIVDFKAYMKDMYSEEKQFMINNKSGTGNIMTSLLRASANDLGKE
jgi:hypothetical protein